MKKSIAKIVFGIFLILTLTGCNSAKETWHSAYAAFLKNLPEPSAVSFSLRDLNQDAIPELMIFQADEESQTKHLSVYSYNGDICKIGECDDPNSYAGSFYVSDSPMFPGLFSLKWGGGIEQYGCLTINEGKLIFDDLWHMDRTSEAPKQQVLSDHKELVDESMRIFSSSDPSDDTLITYSCTEDIINQLAANKLYN